MLLPLPELAGCATLPAPPWSPAGADEAAPVTLLAQALEATPAARESLWRSLRDQDSSAGQKLRRALLQSVPEHSGYNPSAARHQLRQLVAQPITTELRAVAQLRLRELETTEQCQTEVRSLRQRMSSVIDIERQFDRSRP